MTRKDQLIRLPDGRTVKITEVHPPPARRSEQGLSKKYKRDAQKANRKVAHYREEKRYRSRQLSMAVSGLILAGPIAFASIIIHPVCFFIVLGVAGWRLAHVAMHPDD